MLPVFRALSFSMAFAITTASALAADEQVTCTMFGCETTSIEISPFAATDNFTVDQVWNVVNDILGVSGLAPNFQVVATEEVGNAAAIVIEEARYLAFNPNWMKRYREDANAKWTLYAIMAHEVGHHLQGHTLSKTGSKPPTELEADEYAGFTLAALGADLSEAQSLFATLPESGSATHPPRHQRLQAVQRGWERRAGRAAPAANPAPAPATMHVQREISVGETCQNVSYSGAPARVCVSSALPPQGSNRYYMEQAFDGNRSTAWVEGASGHGIGEYMVIEFSRATQLSKASFINGYAKSDRTFSRNSRVRQLHITASDGTDIMLNLSDHSDLQSTSLAAMRPVTWLRFAIADVFAGTHYTDTAITELYLQ